MLSLSVLAEDLETRVLVTPQLKLQRVQPEDLEDEINLQLNPEVMKFIRPIEDRAVLATQVTKYTAKWTAEVGTWVGLSAFLAESGERVGLIVFRIVDTFDDRAEIGYRLHPQFHGRGLGREAVQALVQYLVAFAGIHTIFGVAVADNKASWQLMVSIGMQQEAHMRESAYLLGRWYDDVMYGMLASEWLQRSGNSATIYVLVSGAAWRKAQSDGYYTGSVHDMRDGFIHASTAAQVKDSAQKHRAGEQDLILVAADSRSFGSDLRWEPSRRGAYFPHLYSVLKVEDVKSWVRLDLSQDGHHQFPRLHP